MIPRNTDFADEIVLLKRENERMKKRLDRIDVLFNQAQNMIDALKFELIDIKRVVDTAQWEMDVGRRD